MIVTQSGTLPWPIKFQNFQQTKLAKNSSLDPNELRVNNKYIQHENVFQSSWYDYKAWHKELNIQKT